MKIQINVLQSECAGEKTTATVFFSENLNIFSC